MMYILKRRSPSGVEQRPITSHNYHALWCMAWAWELRGVNWTARIEDES